MTNRLKHILSWWFILQIVLPFTAPLQTLDLHDLMAPRSHQSAPRSPESTVTPTISEAPAATFVSALAPAVLDATASVVVVRAAVGGRLLSPAFDLSPAPHVQHSVLRL